MNNQIKSILYWLIAAILLVALWPLIKWLIIILLVFIVYIYFRFRHEVKKVNNFKYDDPFIKEDTRREEDYVINDYDRDEEVPTISDDIIDADVKPMEEMEDR